jgi:hypothetical protein
MHYVDKSNRSGGVGIGRDGGVAIPSDLTDYRQIDPRENSLGLHYTDLADLSLRKSATYTTKNPKIDPQSAKSG